MTSNLRNSNLILACSAFSAVDTIYSFLDKDFYQIVKIYKDKPSIQKIEDDLKEFDNKKYKKNLEIYNYEGSLLGLNDEEKEQYKDEINLER